MTTLPPNPGEYTHHRRRTAPRKVLDPLITEPDDPEATVTQGTMHRQLIELLAASEVAKRADRRWMLRYVVLPIVLAGISGVTGAVGYYKNTEDARPEGATKEDVEAAVDVNAEAVARIAKAEKRVERLEQGMLEQQVQISEGFDFVSLKLDAISTKAAKVPEPESLAAARRKAEAIRKKRRQDLFDEKAVEE